MIIVEYRNFHAIYCVRTNPIFKILVHSLCNMTCLEQQSLNPLWRRHSCLQPRHSCRRLGLPFAKLRRNDAATKPSRIGRFRVPTRHHARLRPGSWRTPVTRSRDLSVYFLRGKLVQSVPLRTVPRLLQPVRRTDKGPNVIGHALCSCTED
jgi:hypothetical protein